MFVIHDSLSTHSCLGIALTNVVWNFDTFENNVKTNYQFAKYLKEIYYLHSDLHFHFKCFQDDSNI